MNTKSKNSNKKPKKRIKKLRKRLARDLEEVIALSVKSGDLSTEAAGSLLRNMGNVLARAEEEFGASKNLRESGRFLEYLHKQHGQVLEDDQLRKEEHDRWLLSYIKKLSQEGKTPAEVARIMRKDGNRVTADGIRRILVAEG